MSKEDTSPGGLLSKVVRFVRNPTVNWADLDAIDTERESQYSKQMLKEMIERKRRNDFVRRREFDQLRKLRQRDMLVGQRTEDPTARPSFFQSSLTSPIERAVTIKKIDEIEAQMSMQWWKGKPHANAPVQAPDPPPPGAGEAPPSVAFAPTARAPLATPPRSQESAAPLFADDSMSIAGFGGVSSQVLAQEGEVPPGPMACTPAPESEEFVHDPDLEEAAIRFANGDHDGAEAGLLDVLAQQREGEAEVGAQLEIWMTLFDLYRATGQQDRFDTLSIDFAARFGRSAPLWFSMPEQLGLVAAPPPTEVPAQRDLCWDAPARLGLQSIAALRASLACAASPWTLNWSRLAAIEEDALSALADEFTHWADQDVQIVCVGADDLQGVLQAHTQSGDRASSPEWWRLRMAMLRLMGRPDEFEMVALDYCVTYEVSPASWMPARCGYSDASGDGFEAVSVPDLAAPTPSWSEPGQAPSPNETAQAPCGLSGHIEGDAGTALEGLEALAPAGMPLLIPCERLIRVDFSAAGSVLNWAAAQQAQGREVQFHRLHRLVAVFFNVVGLNEYARVVPRKN